VERFESVFGESILVSGLRMLPEGIAAFSVAMVFP
jgi:hypothetical protein